MLDSRNICIYIARLNGSLTQQVEYLPFKQRVAGSNPARPTKKIKGLWLNVISLFLLGTTTRDYKIHFPIEL